jgi:hypothetical protein
MPLAKASRSATTLAIGGLVAIGLSPSATARVQPKDLGSVPSAIVSAEAAVNDKNISHQNIERAVSKFRKIATPAINGNTVAVGSNLADAIAEVSKLREFVPAQTYRDLQDRLSDLNESQKNKDLEGIALAAAENYRTLRLAQDPSTLSAPIEVYLLDYNGLKMLALARPNSPGWQRFRSITDETIGYWTQISPQIKQTALRKLTGAIIADIKRSLAEQNLPELRFVLKLQLDAVTLIKNDFMEVRGHGVADERS